MHRVGVQRRQVDLLLVEEDGVGRDGAAGDDVAIGHDDSQLPVDHEAGGHRAATVVHVERHHRAHPHHDHATRDAFERALPVRLAPHLDRPRGQAGERYTARRHLRMLSVGHCERGGLEHTDKRLGLYAVARTTT